MPRFSAVETTSAAAAAAAASSAISPAAAAAPLVTVPSQMASLSAVVTRAAAAAHPPSPSTAAATHSPYSPITASVTAAAPPSSPAGKPSTTSPSPATAPAREVCAVRTADIHGLRPPIVAALHLEFHRLALRQAPEAVGSDGSLMDEQIFAAVVRGYESEPLLAAEPLHDAGRSLPLRHPISAISQKAHQKILETPKT
ncbi:hypothetical protein ACLOJK_033131 [Asimina triloba]